MSFWSARPGKKEAAWIALIAAGVVVVGAATGIFGGITKLVGRAIGSATAVARKAVGGERRAA